MNFGFNDEKLPLCVFCKKRSCDDFNDEKETLR